MSSFRAVKITDHVWWVGAIDWAIRDFHGYLTSQGTTYNAYLVLADKITLLDTVKAPFAGEMLARIASMVRGTHPEWSISEWLLMSTSISSGFITDAMRAIISSKKGAFTVSTSVGVAPVMR